MKLTLSVTTIPSRLEKLYGLVDSFALGDDCRSDWKEHEQGHIRTWADDEAGLELIAYCTEPYDDAKPDPRLTFGHKRNVLLALARGYMVSSFDDDDRPHPNYRELILPHCHEGVDVIGYKVACYGYAQTNGEFDPSIMEPADVSIKYDGWYNNRNGFKYVRCPHHIVPVRAEHVRAIGFKPMHHGEDHEYSMRMRDSGLLKTEVYIPEYLYYYLFNAKKKKGE